jgi:hypothetical protein
MTAALSALVLIGGLLVIGVLVGIGVLLFTWLRERHEAALGGAYGPVSGRRRPAA